MSCAEADQGCVGAGTLLNILLHRSLRPNPPDCDRSPPEDPLRFTSEIVERKQANQYALAVDHRQAAEAAVSHQLRRVTQIILLPTANDSSGYRRFYFYLCQSPALRVYSHADVAVSQKANRAAFRIH